MIKKNGFVMIETIVVITILTIGLVSLYASYSLILSKSVTKSNHDNISYIYKAYHVAKYLEDTNQLTFTGNFKTVPITDVELINIANTFKIDKIYLAKGAYSNIVAKTNLLTLDGSTIFYLNTMDGYINTKTNVIVKFKEYEDDPVLSEINFAGVAI